MRAINLALLDAANPGQLHAQGNQDKEDGAKANMVLSNGGRIAGGGYRGPQAFVLCYALGSMPLGVGCVEMDQDVVPMLSFLLFFVAPPAALILFGILIALVRPKLRSIVVLAVSFGVTGHIGGLLLIPQLLASGYAFGDWVAFVGILAGIVIGVTGGLIQRRRPTSRGG